MLLLADWVIPVSRPPVPHGGVRVEDGLVAAVGEAAELRARFPQDEVQTFPGCALLPGLVNVHTHLEYSVLKGFAPPSGFGLWMLRLLLARRRLAPADYEVSALWGARECARSGVTTVADCAFDGRVVARAAREVGLRARVHQEVFGLDDAGLPEKMRRLEEQLEDIQEEGGSLVEPGVSPHAPYTVSPRLYREAARFARRTGLRLATHVAESPAEVELLTRGTGSIARAYRLAQLGNGKLWRAPGVSPVRYVAAAGALGPLTLVVHAVQVDAEDLALLGGSGAAVAHCPRSNLRLRCGLAPVAAMCARGVKVGLGTDSLASNDDLDLFAEMRAALNVSASLVRAAESLDKLVTAENVLRMATLDGAAALGWADRVGSLEEGKQADVVVVALPDAEGSAETERRAEREGVAIVESVGATVVERVVRHASAADVRLTMVAGRVIFRGDGPREPSKSSRELEVKLVQARDKLGRSRSLGPQW